MTPCVVADTAVVALVARPTSEGPEPAVSKNTRSPAWIEPFGTAVPTPNCAKLERGTLIPAWLIAHDTRPEQSKAFGPAAAAREGEPTFVRALATAAWTPDG